MAYHIHEPLGVVGQIIPWNFPLLMAAWKLAPALAAGNCVVLKPAEQTPLGICVLLELIGDLLPPGVLNVVQGFGREAGEALATSKRIAKIAFTGSTPVGSHILACGGEHHSLHRRAGRQEPEHLFRRHHAGRAGVHREGRRGPGAGLLQPGRGVHLPVPRAGPGVDLPGVHGGGAEKVRAIKRGDPLDTETMVGAQASQQQYEKILSYLDIAQQEGAEVLTGGSVEKLEGNLASGYYIQPTLLKGHNKMRVFQEEIFGPVVGVTTFRTKPRPWPSPTTPSTASAPASGPATSTAPTAWAAGSRPVAWTNCYHLYPAHAAFGGYKKSGVGRETHKMMLDHYQQTKNLLVSYDINPLGFF